MYLRIGKITLSISPAGLVGLLARWPSKDISTTRVYRTIEDATPKTAMTRVDGEYVRQSREECRVVRSNLMHQLQIAYALRDASQKSTFVHHLVG